MTERERILEEAAKAVCGRCAKGEPRDFTEARHRKAYSGYTHAAPLGEWCAASEIWKLMDLQPAALPVAQLVAEAENHLNRAKVEPAHSPTEDALIDALESLTEAVKLLASK
jgi:hypothetical protein